MRLSTAGMHRSSIDAILEHQGKLSKTQNQVATGKKFQTASEDPIGAARVAGLERKLRGQRAIRAQFKHHQEPPRLRGTDSRRHHLGAAERSRLGAGRRKCHSRPGGAQDDRQPGAAESRGPHGHGQPPGCNGEYLFAGTSTATRPFAQGATGVNYQGDQTTRQIRISSTQSLADVHAGVDAFMGIAERNGVFRTTVSAANTGNATISVGMMTDPTAWVPANYTLQFTSATDWQVVDDSTPTPVTIASGTGFTSGQSISFLGVSVAITGAPAANDSFSVTPAQKTDIFRHARRAGAHPRGRQRHRGSEAAFQAQTGASIMNLDAALERVVSVRAEVGTRLQAIDTAGGFPRVGGGRSAGADFRHPRCRLRLGDQQAEPAVHQPAGRPGRVFENRAIVAIRLPLI
jgi:flagellar hook-associated protein 3 FlgL